jgi:glycosyltransferase involved in cell wall biosynthesis
MNKPLDATIIITTYDRYELVPDAIKSLLKQNINAQRYEIIVVDNCPMQPQHEELKSAFADEEIVRIVSEPQKGISAARNTALKLSRAPIVCFIDDDALAHPNWLSELLTAFRSYGDNVGIVGGSISPKWQGPVPDWIEKRHLGHLSIVDWGGKTRIANKNEWFAGCNIAFDRQTLIEVGGFNSSLGRSGGDTVLLSNEESDVTRKIEALGKLRVYAPKARVEHLIFASRLHPDWFRRRLAWQAVSDFIMKPDHSAKYAAKAAERVQARLTNQQHLSIIEQLLLMFQRRSKKTQPAPEIDYAYDMTMAMLSGHDIFYDASSDTQVTKAHDE